MQLGKKVIASLIILLCFKNFMRLQLNLDRIYLWYACIRLPLNINRCNVMSYGPTFNPLVCNYQLEGIKLNRLDVIRDLGGIFDQKLSFVLLIQNTIGGAYTTLGFVMRNMKDFRSINTLKLFYVTFVRSRLECAYVIWNPIHAIHIITIENVQRRFFRSAVLALDGVY